MTRPRIADIVTIAARLADLPEQEVKEGHSYLHLCAVRHAVYCAARKWGHSFPAIGRAVGGRDHSTVIHGLANRQRFSFYIDDFDTFCAEVDRLSGELPRFVADTAWRPALVFAIRNSREAHRNRRRERDRLYAARKRRLAA